MWLRDASAAISRERRDHEIMPSSWALLRMEANSAYSVASGMQDKPREFQFTEPEGKECLEAASAAWFVLPGQCTMSNLHGRVHCFSLSR